MKDKDFISKHMGDAIMKVEAKNVIQIIIDNADVCKETSTLIELEFPPIYWTSCVVHILNLALKNTCATKNTKINNDTYKQCLISHKLLMMLPLLKTLLWTLYEIINVQ